MSETRLVFEAALESARQGRKAVLATIVNAKGSTPRGVGSRMLIDLETGLVGTVGGGCGEAQVIETAREVFETGIAQVARVDLTEDYLSWSPAVCGGIFDVLIERV
ncbi:MAG: XdhC family protein [Gemmatimonadota bacterium]|jgi:xanthine dehydrogenase accessory factor|nr:XdhC family protein [Gemmatimonadota bacterium]